jgi:hypothetical protein
MRLALAASFLLTVGVSPSSADTVTFNNGAGHSGGTFNIGSNVSIGGGAIDAVARVLPTLAFVITGTCGTAGTFGCIDVTTGELMGPDMNTAANDYVYNGGGTVQVHGGIASLGLANGTLLFSASFDPTTNVILQFDNICQSDPMQCTGTLTGTLSPGMINPALALALGVNPSTLGGNDQTLFFAFSGSSLLSPAGTATANTSQLQVVTPAATTAVPEPGSLMLLGSGLLLFAKVMRGRRM